MIKNEENSAVKIAVRERPLRDYSIENSSVINYHPNGKNIIVNESVFTFDYVLQPTSSQSEIFNKLIKPLVVNLKLGFNCTALAYGQTGTGKSYTMGLNSKSFNDDDIGVIPRALKEIIYLFNTGAENQVSVTTKQFDLAVSFIEIYNEKVYDLLGENTNEPIVAKGYKYTGGTRKRLNSLEDCYAILMQGNKNRHVRPTKMNSQSSRSHAIFTIHVRTIGQNINDEEVITSSCMNIVDLAGSEGVRRTGHQGVAMSEGVNINQGLLSIGKVLQAMSSGSKVIPYRDSVLSSVLQESLNSNSYLTLLACVSPHREDLSETLSTLRFAQNAKQLKNAPEINNIMADLKKNAKQKQTPYKVKPLTLHNKVTPLKVPYTNMFGTQVKAGIKSNTFCTPKKQKLEVNKCNQTEISNNYDRKKISNADMNLPKMNRFDSTHIRDSLFNRSLDSNATLLSLNVSTSTSIEGQAQPTNTRFSPIIRKCMTELRNDLEENLLKIVQKNMQNIVTVTPASKQSPKNQTVLPSTIRQELKSIMKEVLFENSKICNNVEETNQTVQNTLKSNTKCQLNKKFNNSGDLFKIPELPAPEHFGPLTSSPITNAPETSLAQTFFAASNSNNTVYRKSLHRSCRVSEKQIELSLGPIDSEIVNQSCLHRSTRKSLRPTNDEFTNANQTLRRSSRKSVLQMYQNRRQSIRLAKTNENVGTLSSQEPLKEIKTSKENSMSKKSKNVNSKNITLIDAYCNGSTNTKTTLTKHRKAVLDLLNKGSMKDLQILPQVGQKTAYLLVTQRTLSGKFKNWTQVEKLPIWRGTGWERFAQTNMIK